MSDSLDALDYYTLLGVSDEASTREIKRAFRKFARRYHPDRYAGASEAKVEKAARIYRRGSEAFQVLTDAEQRNAYDEALKRGMLRLTEDAIDKVTAKDRVPQKPKGPIRSLEAMTYYKQAASLAKDGDWTGAWKALKAADQIEPNNRFIESRLMRVERALRGF